MSNPYAWPNTPIQNMQITYTAELFSQWIHNSVHVCLGMHCSISYVIIW